MPRRRPLPLTEALDPGLRRSNRYPSSAVPHYFAGMNALDLLVMILLGAVFFGLIVYAARHARSRDE